MEDFGAIPIFVAVVTRGSISGAAADLNITKSAVSKRISILEQRLGVRLLHRTTRRLSMTEAGERYFEFASKAIAAAEDAELAVEQIQGKPKGKLKINAPMSFGLLYVSELVPMFLKKYPDIHIDLVLDDKPLDLIENNFDIAIRAGNIENSRHIAKVMLPLHSIVCASPDYLRRHGTPQHPSDLTLHNCILFSYSPEKNTWKFSRKRDSIEIAVNGNYAINSSEAIKTSLLQGLGVGRLPTFIAGKYVRSGELIRLFPDYTIPHKHLHILYPERHYTLKKVSIFLEFLKENLGIKNPIWDQKIIDF